MRTSQNSDVFLDNPDGFEGGENSRKSAVILIFINLDMQTLLKQLRTVS